MFVYNIFIMSCPGHFLPHDERAKKKVFHMKEKSRNAKSTIRLCKNQLEIQAQGRRVGYVYVGGKGIHCILVNCTFKQLVV